MIVPSAEDMLMRIVIAFITVISCWGADLWGDIPNGQYVAGFRFDRGVDATRRINGDARGTALGLAIWYPARRSGSSETAVSDTEYRLLSFENPPNALDRAAFLDRTAAQMVAWRHVGIVPLTIAQARSALDARGRAIRNAPAAAGRFPVVVIMGGPWYLSTTAEILASNGFTVVAPVRYREDQVDEIQPSGFTLAIENDLRDAEWALAELGRYGFADTAHISALGHGGGGMVAMFLAMRHRGIQAVANIDSGNFSSRTNLVQFPFFNARLLRVPYLFLATGETTRTLDQFDQFEKLKFSQRYQVTIEDDELRHHDLSNVGRAVSAVLGMRGPAQSAVMAHYADTQMALVRFLKRDGFDAWLRSRSGMRVSVRESQQPAPFTQQVLNSLSGYDGERLRQIRRVDPDAPLFEEDSLVRIANAARTRHDLPRAASIGLFGLEAHPRSMALRAALSAIFEDQGDSARALETARSCAATEPQPDFWWVRALKSECDDRAKRLALH